MADAAPGVPAPVRRCPLGCGEAGRAIGELPTTAGFALSRESFTLARCGCGALLYLSPAPTAADLRAMYVDHGQFGDEYTAEARVREILAYMRQCLDRIVAQRRWPRARTLRILEVGAGLAWMCRAAKERDGASVTVAQDVSPEAAGRCAWVDAYVQGDVGDARLDARAPYDVISLTHVIEHLIDPVAVLRTCRDRLAPDGIVFVTAPHRPSGWRDDAPDLARWTGYSYNHVPAHVQYFSERSLARLAEAIGCELVHWSHRHEAGEAFEGWLAHRRAAGRDSWWRRVAAKLR